MISDIARADTMISVAEKLLDRRDLCRAIELFDSAEHRGADPDRCSGGRWMAQMLLGNFEAAWKESDRIRNRGVQDPNRFWHGDAIDNKRVIVRCLHGLGDAVQYLRYMPLLQARASEVVLEVPPALLQLAPFFEGVRQVITWGEQAPEAPPQWDIQIEVVELPYVFRTHSGQLPITTRYLRPARARARLIRPVSAESLCVGVVWGSGEWNPSRSVPFRMVRTLLEVVGCEFWNLQGGSARAEWKCVESLRCTHDGESCATDIVALAQMISELDLVITPDTFAAHLAGAIGTPVWLMLEASADWRWMLDRDDSPWYPGMCLFRQPVQGDWHSVIRQVRRSLEQVIVSKPRGLVA